MATARQAKAGLRAARLAAVHFMAAVAAADDDLALAALIDTVEAVELSLRPRAVPLSALIIALELRVTRASTVIERSRCPKALRVLLNLAQPRLARASLS